MARQPERIIPFEPFASGHSITPKGKKPTIITDDRRSWFSTVPGLVFSNEILVPGTGAPPVGVQHPSNLTEAIRLRLPRPEPVTLSFHPWWINDASRWRQISHQFAEVEDSSGEFNGTWGRIYVEWGTGSSRAWTYFDAGPGSLQLPSVSDVRVSGWAYSQSFILSVNAQIGYASADLSATWTSLLRTNVNSTSVTKRLPPFSRTITGALGGNASDVNNEVRISLLDLVFAHEIMRWTLKPGIVPNTQNIPNEMVDVPLSGGAAAVTVRIVTTLGFSNASAIVRVKV